MPLFDWDPFEKWNPLDNFWRLTYPLFNPRPDASPVRVNAPAPIWDLPSPYGNVYHPDTKDSIPHFVHPDYFQKLYTEPPHEVVHPDPGLWMIAENFNTRDLAYKFPLCVLSGPAFILGFAYVKKAPWPTNYSWFSSTVVGATLGFSVIYQDSENRLQGYLPNEADVKYWKERADTQRRILAGEIPEPKPESLLGQGLQALFGAKKVDVEALEKEYYGDK